MAKKLSEMTLEELWHLFPVVLTEHKEFWKEWYSEEETLWSNRLPCIYRISHIGSTAIPIIDILVELPKEIQLLDYKEVIINSGYICMSESSNRLSFNKGYTEVGFVHRVFHLHLRYVDDNDELYFRDYLVEHSAIAKEYEKLKLALWKEYEHDRDDYTNAKTDFIKKYTGNAKVIYGNRYRQME